MSYYDECSKIVAATKRELKCQEATYSISTRSNSKIHSTLPSFLNEKDSALFDLSVFYISDLHLDYHIINIFGEGATDSQIKDYIHSIVLVFFKGEYAKAVRGYNNCVTLFLGDVSASFGIAKLFYKDFVETLIKEKGSENGSRRGGEPLYIYAILGNHELWNFTTYEECRDSYKSLFDELGIIFLDGRITWLGPHYKPISIIDDEKTKERKVVPLQRETNPRDYDAQVLFFGNAIITGDIGYAPLNRDFNANQYIYGEAIDEKKEEELSRKWREVYRKAKEYSKERRCSLVVLTHMPVSNWLNESDDLSGCVFFSGHTHRNTVFVGENDVFYYADNQVGYKSNHFRFKRVVLYRRINPFAAYADGYREIKLEEYIQYYYYMNEAPGVGTIEQHIEHYNGKLYVIKREEYYGFFLITEKGVYICNGGQICKIGNAGSVDRYYNDFSSMVGVYLKLLSPLRQFQEQVSEYIKGIGGTGKIHGTIVDLDFENHIMIDTPDGSLTFYNSPLFGTVKTYGDLHSLLQSHCPKMEKQYLKKGIDVNALSPMKKAEKASGSYEKVDVKNSPYVVSKRLNALQRLFDKHILRDWNDVLLQTILVETKKYLSE